MEITNANAVVSDLVDLLQHSFDKSIEFEQRLESNLWPTKADGTQLEQILLNLCVNAKDAMPAGVGRITIKTRNYQSDQPGPLCGEYVVIDVCDNGSGMSEELRARIFEPFFSTKTPDKGTGLGLAMSYGIIEQHGGHIKCTSEEGRGTCFSVFLPKCDDAPASTCQEAGASAAPGKNRHLDGPASGRVLVVDDEAVVRAVAKGLLSHAGYDVSTAEDGRDALESLAGNEGDVDLVILDLTMPRMTGKEAFREIRSKYPGLPVIICSGYLVDLDAFEREAGFYPDAFIQKPYEVDHMLSEVRRVLGAERIGS